VFATTRIWVSRFIKVVHGESNVYSCSVFKYTRLYDFVKIVIKYMLVTPCYLIVVLVSMLLKMF